jgi:hypothetical protein
MLRFPQRIPGLYEGESPAGQVVIFGAGIIRNSSANPTMRLWTSTGLTFEKKDYLFESSQLSDVILSNSIGRGEPPASGAHPI